MNLSPDHPTIRPSDHPTIRPSDHPMSQSTEEHRRQSPQRLSCAVITVSDTRTLENDTGGALVVELLEAAGHRCLSRQIIPDDSAFMRALVEGLAGAATRMRFC